MRFYGLLKFHILSNVLVLFFKWPHASQNNLTLILNEDILLQNNNLCDFVENGSCDKNVTNQITQPL